MTIRTKRAALIAGLVMACMASAPAGAALITFDTIVSGATSFGYDGDGDEINDATFSTTDPSGFNTVGPGPNMSYINEPGIEGQRGLNPDLRVDFARGAVGTLGFGFAVNTGTEDVQVHFRVFAADDSLLASTDATAAFTTPPGPSGRSSFPEALVSLSFSGLAAYATLDFDGTSVGDRYIIDNFQGTFGSTETIAPTDGIPVPEPLSLSLFGAGLTALGLLRRRKP